MAHQARILTRLANQIDATEECAAEATLEVPFLPAGNYTAASEPLQLATELGTDQRRIGMAKTLGEQSFKRAL